MEIERHLFRISERALKNENAGFWAEKLVYLFATLAVGFGLCLLGGHALVLPHNAALSQCIRAAGVQLQADQFYYVTDDSLAPGELDYYAAQGRLLHRGEQCSAVRDRNSSAGDEGSLVFGWDEAGMFMSSEKKAALRYGNVTFALREVSAVRKALFGFDVLAINELLDNPLGAIPFPEKLLMVKSRSAYVFHQARTASALGKAGALGKVVAAFLVISVVTSLYIYGTIVAAPAVILLILRCCRFLRAEGMNDIFKLFPWIGVHAILREASPTAALKASTADICKAVLYYFLFLYLVYYASIIWIDKRLFLAHTELGLQELIFGYVAMTEFAAVVFMRTRSFLKYFPSLHSLILVAVLFYAQVVDFGLKKLACYAAFSLGAALFAWMVLRLEIPAHNSWDPNSHNTPREDRPRIGYFPLFNLAWLKNLPDEWTMMMPLFGREHFSPRELALVDRNNELLAEALGNQ